MAADTAQPGSQLGVPPAPGCAQPPHAPVAVGAYDVILDGSWRGGDKSKPGQSRTAEDRFDRKIEQAGDLQRDREAGFVLALLEVNDGSWTQAEGFGKLLATQAPLEPERTHPVMNLILGALPTSVHDWQC